MPTPKPVDYEQYMRSAKWRNIASKMKKLANFTCERCKCQFHPSELEVHHLNYDRLGDENPSDLQVLCRATCHPIADAERVQRVAERREERAYGLAADTFLSKKYGENFAHFANEGMYEEFDRWRSRRNYGETGEE